MSLPKKKLIDAAAAITAARTVVISGHVNPDGDALGSVLAMDWALRSMGKKTYPISADEVPETLLFLPGAERIKSTADLPRFDLAVLCDLEGLKRVGSNADVVSRADHLLVIDHHVPWHAIGDVRLIDTHAAATAVLIHRLLHHMKVTMTAEIATCLLTGIVTDTGSFKYPNTDPHALRIAAKLVEAGGQLAQIAEKVYESRSFESIALLGLAIRKLKSVNEGRLLWSSISLADFRQLGAGDEHSEGIVNYLRSAKTAEVTILFREIDRNRVRVSLRSREPWSVAEIAQQFGGGGHHRAAGCSFATSLENAETTLLKAVESWMGSSISSNRPA